MDASAPSKEKIALPQLFPTLEWILDSPPNVHQFDEPPVSLIFIFLVENLFTLLFVNNIFKLIVEIEHLKNLKVEEH